MAASSGCLRSCTSMSSSSFCSLARKTAVRRAVAASTVKTFVEVEKTKKKEKDLHALAADAAEDVLGFLRMAGKETSRKWQLHAGKTVESSIISCRLFALIGVAGTLMGSILCFVEGCFLVWTAFLRRFHESWENIEQAGEVTTLVMEGTESFLVGTAMVSFGMGLFTMFVGSRESRKEGLLPPCTRMECLSEAKAELGRAVVMLLLGGLVEKFKSVNLSSGLDLACFAGAIFVSSASIFLLSRLHRKQRSPRRELLDFISL